MHGKDLEGQLLGLARWMIFYGEMHLCSDVPWFFPSGFSLRLPRMNEQPNSPPPYSSEEDGLLTVRLNAS